MKTTRSPFASLRPLPKATARGPLRPPGLSLVCLALLLLTPLFPARAEAQMALRHVTTDAGAITITGNTLGLSANADHTGPGRYGSIGMFTTVDDTQTAPGWPAGTTANWRDNSSAAELDIDRYHEVLHAELVWAGSFDYYPGEQTTNPSNLDAPISFQTPAGTYSVTQDPTTAHTIAQRSAGGGFDVNYFVRTADVTELVREGGGGTYVVSGVYGTTSVAGRELNAAGWTLVVIYRDQGGQTRNLSLFLGGRWVDEASTLDTEVSGFCAPPSGPVRGRLLVSAMEGDSHFDGNAFLIRNPTAPSVFLPLEGPNNPANNFFASQINDRQGALDTRGTFGDRNHLAVNAPASRDAVNVDAGRQGWDITGIALRDEDGHLGNAQTSTVLRAVSSDPLGGGSANDSFVLTVLALEIEVNAPGFLGFDNVLTEIVVPAGSAPARSDRQVSVGDRIDVAVELANTGEADADSVTFRMDVPAGLRLRPGSFTFGGTPLSVDTAALESGVALGALPRQEAGDSQLVFFSLDVEAALTAGVTLRPSWTYTWRSCADAEAQQATAFGDAKPFGTASLFVEKHSNADGAVPVGSEVLWTVTVRNDGSEPTRMAWLRDDLHPALRYVPGSTEVNGASVPDVGGTMPFVGGAVVQAPGADAGHIAPDEEVVVTYRTEVIGGAGGWITNRVAVSEREDADADGDADAEADLFVEEEADSTPADDSTSTTPPTTEPDGSDTEPGETSETSAAAASPSSESTDAPSLGGPGAERRPPPPERQADPNDGQRVATESGCCAIATASQRRSSTAGALLLFGILLGWRRRAEARLART